jgi:hypothetical protein
MARSQARVAALLAVGFLAAPASAELPDAPTLLAAAGLTPDQVQQVMSGQIVRGSIQPASDREIVTSMTFLVPTSPSQIVADLKAGLGTKVDPDTLTSGVFRGAGSAADLAKLTLEPGAQKRAVAYNRATGAATQAPEASAAPRRGHAPCVTRLHASGLGTIVGSELHHLSVPSLTLDVDVIDDTFSSRAEIESHLESFFEMIEGSKAYQEGRAVA